MVRHVVLALVMITGGLGHIEAVWAGTVTFDDGVVHVINDATHNQDFLIVSDGPGLSPDTTTRQVLLGAVINTPATVQNGSEGISAREHSQLDVLGGQISASGTGSVGVQLIDEATSTISGGQISVLGIGSEGVIVNDNAVLNIDGGTIDASGTLSFGVSSLNHAMVRIDGGAINATGLSSSGVFATNDAIVDITGGTITAMGASADGINALLNATVNLSGGQLTAVDNHVQALDTSTINIIGTNFNMPPARSARWAARSTALWPTAPISVTSSHAIPRQTSS